MKWTFFAGACVVSLITLGILAVDERDVVWEERTPLCPHCRAELSYYSLACRQCSRTLDWTPTQEPCVWCVDRETARVMRDAYLTVRAAGEAHPERLASWSPAYFREMEAGACAHCGGQGFIGVAGDRKFCEVCRDRKDCVGCDGSRAATIGDERARRRMMRRRHAWSEASRRAELTGQPINERALRNDDALAVAGHVEAETLAGPDGRVYLAVGLERARQALEAVLELAAARAPDGKPASGE
ncbi:MAG: hypothetical protein V3T86_07005 [Planctomycetota bacterium]